MNLARSSRAGLSVDIDPALAALTAPTLNERLLALARLAAERAGSCAAAVGFLDPAGQLQRGYWHGVDPVRSPDAARIDDILKSALDPGGIESGRSPASIEAHDIRCHTLQGESRGVVALIHPAGPRPLVNDEDGPAIQLVARSIEAEAATLRYERQQAHYERWFKRLDGQLRILDRERQKFLAVVNRDDAEVFVADLGRTIRWTNRHLVDCEGGADSNGWQGRPCADFCRHLAGESCGPDPLDCPVARALASNEAAHREIHRTVGAEQRELYLSALPILGLDGKPEEVVVLIQDLSDLKIVQRLEARYRTLFDRSGNAILMLDPASLRIVLANETACRLLGRSSSDLSEMTLDQLHSPGEWGRLSNTYREGLSGEPCPSFEATAWTGDSEQRVVDVAISRLEVDARNLAVVEFRDLTERRRAEIALHHSENRLRTVVANAPLVLFTLDRNGIFTMSEGRGLERMGLKPGEVVGRSVFDVYADNQDICESNRRALAGHEFKEVIDVGSMSFETWFSPMRDARGQADGVLGVAIDVSTSRRLEQQLQHSQKMEAIGRLAGGVAHDFNNLLTVILGHCEMMTRKVEPGTSIHREAEAVLKAGRRGADLARQLLAFSRKQLVEPKIIDMNRVLADLDGMLRRLIPESIDLTTVLDPGLVRIKADWGQVEQIIMNLVVNARDAVGPGGKITVEISTVTIDAAYEASHQTLTPGPYVQLSVSDTGRGMDAETRLKIFEPFFTTKETGQGTGLGLSIVYGIVRQYGGDIQVYSEIDQGTTFKVYMPRVMLDPTPTTAATPGLRAEMGSGTILLTEDEEGVRALAHEILEMCGYTVLTAANGEEALAISNGHDGPIDLLLTDVVMPGLSGGEVAERLRVLCPGIKVVFMSGYPDDAIVHHGVLDRDQAFVQKPFTIEELSGRIRSMLAG
ncbi:MAG: PAS domain-containing protein [Candidatus Eisenbacteria bacterium]|nr:PAS domain-containing protein [Candidatus Eisenbacteria bacterium]